MSIKNKIYNEVILPLCEEIGMKGALIVKRKAVHRQNFNYLKNTTHSEHTRVRLLLQDSWDWSVVLGTGGLWFRVGFHACFLSFFHL